MIGPRLLTTPVNLAENPVGAGLLAKAVIHSTLILTDPPPSRASPLPHWIGVAPIKPRRA
ncbi:hypothetical protein CUN63_14530 [Pseudomonas sp. ACM7]|nr:hypothetical protein CUN63_14530 [Pseudomonas sp. ACM7]